MAEIVDPIIAPLGVVSPTTTQYVVTGNRYDIAVGGMPFYLAAVKDYPYKRETAPYRRQQIDQTKEPGEQSLLGWWLRSQSSFHLGAGVKYQEPTQGETVGFRFHKSAGVDPWTVGKVTLLPTVDTVSGITGSSTALTVGAIDGNGVSVALVASGANLYRVTSAGTATAITWGGTGTILAITEDGTNYYASNGTAVYTGLLTGVGTGTSLFTYPATVTNVAMSWVKQRLIVGAGTKVWQIVPGAAAPTVPQYTHPTAAWKWTSVVDGPNAVYLSGYAGLSSSIFKLSLDSTGTLPTLTDAVTAADLPGGEYITALGTYVGKYIAIGTNRGVRIGTIDTTGYASSGQITYGPLSVITNGYDPIYDRTISGANVTQFAFEDRFVYATVTNMVDNGDGTLSSGLVRIDLTADLGAGMLAWSTDLRTMLTSTVSGVCVVGSSGKILIVGAGGAFIESANKVESGYLETGLIRYLTLEDKHFKLIKPRINRPMTGDVDLAAVTSAGVLRSIITVTDSVDPTSDITTGLTSPSESVAFRFTMHRSTTDTTAGSTFTGYQLKALPAVKRSRQLTIPLMNFDYEEDRNNNVDGYEGRAADRIIALETIESVGDAVTIQDFTIGEQVQAVIESIEFVRTSPSNRAFHGFGGILYISARTV